MVEALKEFVSLFINFIGFIGLLLIGYSFLSSRSAENKWKVLEDSVTVISDVCTVLGTLLAALSVYFPVNTRPPDKVSIWITAPVAIVICLPILVAAAMKKTVRRPHLVSGIGLLGLAGALFRLLRWR